jgi:hypothetical protein
VARRMMARTSADIPAVGDSISSTCWRARISSLTGIAPLPHDRSERRSPYNPSQGPIVATPTAKLAAVANATVAQNSVKPHRPFVGLSGWSRFNLVLKMPKSSPQAVQSTAGDYQHQAACLVPKERPCHVHEVERRES